jgi:hypothetical protein
VIPGKSPYCIQEDCRCEKCAGHLHGHHHHKKVWGPPCDCCVKTVKVLVRTEKKVGKKVWKPVIETVCDTCCAAGRCAAGPVPVSDDPPPAARTPATQDGSVAPLPPMPEASSPRPASRRGSKPLLSLFAPANWQR